MAQDRLSLSLDQLWGAKPHRRSYAVDSKFLSLASLITITGLDVIRWHVVAERHEAISNGPDR
jgi:hypothetical protein